MTFDQIKYINNYSKEYYKTLLLKYRKDSFIYDWINSKNNKNGYILKLIEDDIKNSINDISKLVKNINRHYNDKELLFGDWLDEFYNSPKTIKQLMLEKEPNNCNNDSVFTSYIAATVDYLSNKYKLSKPDWVSSDKYVYNGVYYAGNTKIKEYQKLLKDTSPIEFSKRNLYVGDNILKRV